MDDHMLERIISDINLIIYVLIIDNGIRTYEELRDTNPKALEAIRALIKAHNTISSYYYKPEYAYQIKAKEHITEYIFNYYSKGR